VSLLSQVRSFNQSAGVGAPDETDVAVATVVEGALEAGVAGGVVVDGAAVAGGVVVDGGEETTGTTSGGDGTEVLGVVEALGPAEALPVPVDDP
jgi:hypothetical protein